MALAEDSAAAITLRAGCSEPGPLAYLIVSSPAKGTLSGTPPNVTYTPEANFHGVDQFAFEASSGSLVSNTAVVSLTITPVNDPPAAVDDEASTTKQTPVTIAVLANDSDIDGDTLTVTSVGQGSRGRTTLNADGTVTYRPDKRFTSGTDAFSYTVSDGQGGSDSATVTVSIAKPSKPPGQGHGHAGSLSVMATAQGAEIVFILAGPATVHAEVLNTAGRPIRTIVADRPLGAGLQLLLWDRRNQNGLTVPAGVYLVRVTAHDESGAQNAAMATVSLR